jgi:DNA-binding LacI/PurR family transcriptional regulator
MTKVPTRQKSFRVTIRTVAEMAGLSTATVSNVVNKTGKVGPATKLRVRDAIQRTKLKPDVNARSLARAFELKKSLLERSVRR